MAKATFVKKARKDIPGTNIKAGESYYWWKFRFGGKHYSKTAPKASQLTQSEYLSQLYDFQEQLGGLSTGDFNEPDDLNSWKEEFVSNLETLRDEQEEKKSNMPEGLQEGPTGELLQERYDSLDSAINELEGIDCNDFDFDEDEAKENAKDELIDEYNRIIRKAGEGDEEDYEPNEDEVQERANQKRQTAVEEWLEDKVGEISSVSID